MAQQQGQPQAPRPESFGLTGTIAPKPSGEIERSKTRTVSVSKRGGESGRGQDRKERDEGPDEDLEASGERDSDNDSDDKPRRSKAKGDGKQDDDEGDGDSGEDDEGDGDSGEDDDDLEAAKDADEDDEDDEPSEKRKPLKTEGKTRRQLADMVARLEKKLDTQAGDIADLRRNPPQAQQRQPKAGADDDDGGDDDLSKLIDSMAGTGKDDDVVTQGDLNRQKQWKAALKKREDATRNKAAQGYQDWELRRVLGSKEGAALYDWLGQHGDKKAVESLQTPSEVVLAMALQRQSALIARLEKKHQKELLNLKQQRRRQNLDDIPSSGGGNGRAAGKQPKLNGRGIVGAMARLSREQGLA